MAVCASGSRREPVFLTPSAVDDEVVRDAEEVGAHASFRGCCETWERLEEACPEFLEEVFTRCVRACHAPQVEPQRAFVARDEFAGGDAVASACAGEEGGIVQVHGAVLFPMTGG